MVETWTSKDVKSDLLSSLRTSTLEDSDLVEDSDDDDFHFMDMVGAQRTKVVGSDYSHTGGATETSCNCRKDQGNFQQEFNNYKKF